MKLFSKRCEILQLPNHWECEDNTQYDFIELALYRWHSVAPPGELKFARMDKRVEEMATEDHVHMPVVHFNAAADDENCLEYNQGNHRVYAAVVYSDVNSKIVIMVPRENVEKIIEVLKCEIAEKTANYYPDHNGILYRLKVKKNDN